VRCLALTVAAILAASPSVRAEPDSDDEDASYAPMPARSVGVSLAGHGSRIDGASEGGFGPALEVALGRGRWQYFAESGIAGVGRDLARDAMSVPAERIDGRMVRGALGTRWIARQWSPASEGGIELLLTSLIGAQRFYFDDGLRRSRPQVGLGFGAQFRGYRRIKLAFRLDTRVLFTPGERAGFSTGATFAW
jgi:hypothetical protein